MQSHAASGTANAAACLLQESWPKQLRSQLALKEEAESSADSLRKEVADLRSQQQNAAEASAWPHVTWCADACADLVHSWLPAHATGSLHPASTSCHGKTCAGMSMRTMASWTVAHLMCAPADAHEPQLTVVSRLR